MAFDFPYPATEGQTYEPAGGPKYTYTSGVWKAGSTSSGGGGGGVITISETPPASPTAGQIWWESDTGSTYIYYNDGNTSQWVQTSAAGIPLDLSIFMEQWGDLLPDLSFSGNKPGLAYSSRYGRWRKHGKLCTYWFDFTLSAKGTGNGSAAIPLPFPATSAYAMVFSGSVGFASGITAGYGVGLSCYIGTDKASLYISRISATTNATGLSAAGEGTFTDTSRVCGQISYEVA